VATDHKTSNVLSELPLNSAIENEIPTYRAISTRAVFSLICGILALLSLAHPFFYLFAILAVVLGISADWNIQRYPDMLTGRRLAQAGAAMGLIFGLGIVTVSTVQGVIRSRDAAGFARHYGDVLKTGSLGDVLWLGMPPVQRKGMTVEDVMQKMHSAKKQEMAAFEMQNGPLKSLKKRLEQKDQELHYVRLEAEGVEGLTPVALALYEVHGPATKEYPVKEEHALAILKGTSTANGMEWWVDGLKYPYKPETAALPEKPVDDGHGHAH
jgi:hypothetical protein